MKVVTESKSVRLEKVSKFRHCLLTGGFRNYVTYSELLQIYKKIVGAPEFKNPEIVCRWRECVFTMRENRDWTPIEDGMTFKFKESEFPHFYLHRMSGYMVENIGSSSVKKRKTKRMKNV